MAPARLQEFAAAYAAAWCSRDPARVASLYAEGGSLTINGGVPAVGRTAIADSARMFMTAFPDIVVALDAIEGDARRAVFRWTLTGTNSGPGGTGHAVRISGHEEWTLTADGAIAESMGHFDDADYRAQLSGLRR